MVVGCGGTGGFVAEGLCRLLINNDIPLLLIDPDRVEPHNLLRQQFYPGDVGKFKSQVLAERLSRQYGRAIAYSVYPFMHDLTFRDLGGLRTMAAQGIIIGCVDNAPARESIAEATRLGSCWWVDAGNGYSSGQVLIGNTGSLLRLAGCFDEETLEVDGLPIPSLQLPSLLVPPAGPVTVKDAEDCAEAVIAEEQSPVINQAMATLVLEFIHRLLQGRLSWMGAYIDLDAGTRQTVPAEPVTVARMLGVKVDTLLSRNSKRR